MSTSPPTSAEQVLRDFMFQQIELWNANRKADFLCLYRHIAPAGLTLEYVAKQTLNGDEAWEGLAHMWDTYNAKVKLQLFECIVNGNDAACYFRNLWSDEKKLSKGIEIYSLNEGSLHARFFH
jgi:hypothetical protein